ncbi:MAG: gliding motility-associated C-terminal domain-containing protein, partial [Bacteroidetes bacterium]|nr:gliding motility-associated C-terminal domain-containing protein [Bacteroidota bacterium]
KVIDTAKIRTIDQIFSILSDTLTCQGDTVTITCTSNPEFTYQWKPISKIVSGGTNNIVKMIIDYSGYYNIEIRDNSGCLFKDSIKINTIEHDFDIFADTFVCIGDTTTIRSTNNPQLVLQWSPLSHIISGANSSLLKVRIDTTKYFVVQITDNLGCKTKDSIKISTLENSFQLVKLDTFICLGDTFQIIAPADPDLSYVWSPVSEIVSGFNTSSPKIRVDKKKQIYLLVNDTSGCFARDTFEFTPIQNFMFLRADTTKCDNDTLKVHTLYDAQFKYAWSPASGILSGGTTHQPIFNLKQSQFVQLTITDNSGCKVRDSIFVSIRPTDVNFVVDTFICPNDTVLIQAPFYVGATYSWTPIANIVSGVNSSAALISAVVNTYFRVNIADTQFCNINDSVMIRIINNENLNFINQDTSWCRGDTIQLRVTDIPGVTYNWNPNQFIVSGNNTSSPRALIKQNTRFVVAITDSKKGCKAADTIDIKIDTNSLKIGGKNNVCIGDLTELRANFIKNAQYDWTPKDWLQNLDTLVKYFRTNDQKYILRATILPDRECVYSDSITVFSRNELADLKVTASKDTFFYSDTIQLNAISKNAISFLWDFDSTLNNRNIASPIAKAIYSHKYYVTVEDFYGCTRRDSIEIFVKIEVCDEPEVFVPNAFSHNGDGKNDVFRVRGDNITEVILTVFDRWGQIIFESADKNIGWDGTFKVTLLEPTVYAYFAKVRCIGGATYTKKGNVSLIR